MTSFPGNAQDPAAGRMGVNEAPKVILYPRSLLEFQANHDGTEKAYFAVINPHPKEVAFKFKTNAESRGVRISVQPSFGVIGPERSQEVAVSLPGAALLHDDELGELKFVIEAWFPSSFGEPDNPFKLKLPLRRKENSHSTSLPSGTNYAVPTPEAAVSSSIVDENSAMWKQHMPMPEHFPSSAEATATSGKLPPCVGTPQCFTVWKDDPKPKSPPSAYFIDTLPLADPGKDEDWCSSSLRNFDLLPYLVSMMVWIGFGVTIGKGFLCVCDKPLQ